MGTLKEQVKDYLDKGIAVSKKAIKKTGTKVQELGEQGVLRYEFERLSAKKRKLCRELGENIYDYFTKDKKKQILKSDENIENLVKEISSVEKEIKKHKKLIDEKMIKKSEKK